MPLITSQYIIDFTDLDIVKNRDHLKLDNNILEAETDLFEYCGHDFTDLEKYPEFPAKAKLALLKLAEYYAYKSADEGAIKGYKSENIGDYSYTVGNTGGIKKPSIRLLVKDYIEATGTGGANVTLRIRSI